MNAEIKGKTLVITIDLDTPRPSSSGLTQIVASSGGPKRTECVYPKSDKPITVNLTAWVK